MLKKYTLIFSLFILSILPAQAQDTRNIYLNDISINTFELGVSAPKVNANYVLAPIHIAGKAFVRGIGVRSVSAIFIELDGKATRFSAAVGHDDGGKKEAVLKFYLLGDKKVLWESKEMKIGDPAEAIDIDVRNIHKLGLLVTNPDSTRPISYGDWAEAFITTTADSLLPVKSHEQKYILTPPPSLSPKLTGPKIFGAGPGHPFLFMVTATGERPMKFTAQHLPAGLSINEKTGIITGTVTQRGLYKVHIAAQNRLGKTSRELRIQIGDTICLTPPIGWNGWNSWVKQIDREKVLASVNAIVSRGLINHGWSYINIDDSWEGQRGGKYNAIQPNNKFPDFKGMLDYIHSLGLKTGIYSTPWVATYQGFAGETSDFEDGRLSDTVQSMPNKRSVHYIAKYHFAKNDAMQWADWGIDFVKYDWHIMDIAPAEEMSQALKNSGRDMVYHLSNGAQFDSAAIWARISNAWRTGGDIRDCWHSVFYWGFTINKWAPYAGPGHWNDPDMLVEGDISTGSALHPTRLTPNEQYTQVSLWSLLAAPLIIGCPVERMDAFTESLFTNDEVIDIDQDALGRAGTLISNENGNQVWAKPMEDGSWAIGLFNTGNMGATPESFFNWGNEAGNAITVDFAKLGLKGKFRIRDVWRQKNLGEFTGSYTTTVPYHGVVLLRMFHE
jgi:alpha-galactosidase